MPSPRATRFALALALTAALHPLAARAQPVSREADVHFHLGLQLADEGNYPAALTEFQRTWELGHNPLVLFNVSATQEAVNRYADALDTLRAFERLAPPEVVRRQRLELDAAVARLVQRIGTLVVSIDAPGLAVSVDGADRDAVEAHAGLRLAVGPHRVVLTAPGFEPQESLCEVAAQSVVVLRAPLRRHQSTVRVESDVESAEVLIDGHVAATTPMPSPVSVDEGQHSVEVRRAGYTTFRAEVDARGQGALVSARLSWSDPLPPEESARVAVRPSEGGATATLDEHPIAIDQAVAVPPGHHRLRVTREDFAAETREVELPVGALTTVDVTLAPTPEFRRAWDARVRRTRALGWTSIASGGALVLAGAVVLAASWGPYQDHLDAFHRLDEDFAQRCVTVISHTCMALEPQRNAAQALVQGDLDVFLLSGILAGVGVAGIVTGAVLHATGPSADRFARAPRVSLRPGLRALELRVSF